MSTGRYAKDDDAINENFYTFLQNFFQVHQNLAGRAVYLAGESHAGHYIPSIVSHIMKKNKEKPDFPSINVKGMMIGNGWIDPVHQYGVSDFAHGHGLITSREKFKLKDMEMRCADLLKKGKYNTKICFDLLDDVVAASGLSSSTRVNMYDVRQLTRSPNPFPPNHELIEAYMNRKDVRLALHSENSKQIFKECADPPYFALQHQDGKSIIPELTHLLDMGLDTLFFSGQYDMICNHMGSEKALDNMNWSGHEEWLKVRTSMWTVDGKTAGYMRELRNLKFLVVLNAGHMVPLDEPKVSLDLVSRFLNKKSFNSGFSKLKLLASDPSACEPASNLNKLGNVVRYSSLSILNNSVVRDYEGKINIDDISCNKVMMSSSCKLGIKINLIEEHFKYYGSSNSVRYTKIAREIISLEIDRLLPEIRNVVEVLYEVNVHVAKILLKGTSEDISHAILMFQGDFASETKGLLNGFIDMESLHTFKVVENLRSLDIDLSVIEPFNWSYFLGLMAIGLVVSFYIFRKCCRGPPTIKSYRKRGV